MPLEIPDPLLQSAEKEVHKVLILNDRLRAYYANMFNSGTDWNKIWMVPIFVDYAQKTTNMYMFCTKSAWRRVTLWGLTQDVSRVL